MRLAQLNPRIVKKTRVKTTGRPFRVEVFLLGRLQE